MTIPFDPPRHMDTAPEVEDSVPSNSADVEQTKVPTPPFSTEPSLTPVTSQPGLVQPTLDPAETSEPAPPFPTLSPLQSSENRPGTPGEEETAPSLPSPASYPSITLPLLPATAFPDLPRPTDVVSNEVGDAGAPSDDVDTEPAKVPMSHSIATFPSASSLRSFLPVQPTPEPSLPPQPASPSRLPAPGSEERVHSPSEQDSFDGPDEEKPGSPLPSVSRQSLVPPPLLTALHSFPPSRRLKRGSHVSILLTDTRNAKTNHLWCLLIPTISPTPPPMKMKVSSVTMWTKSLWEFLRLLFLSFLWIFWTL